MNPDQLAPEPSVPVVTPTPTETPGVDVLVDLPGDTDLYCGPNQDQLIFQDGSGVDLVFDFDPSDTGDTIAIEGDVNGTGLASVDQLAVSDSEHGAVVDLGGGNAIVLAGVFSSDLDVTDFAIFPPIDSSAFV
jgi:hypothetical protein